jgi:hypothetical protein
MPRGLNNWCFDDAVSFLRQHFFELSHVEGSHYFYKGIIDDKDKLVDAHRHAGKTYPILTLKCIIHKSGIPEKIWRQWGEAGNKKARKKIQYKNARVLR